MITKEEWDRAERALSNIYGYIKLKADGYEVTIHLERYGKYSLAMMVYIDGKIKGEWFEKDCEERRRFYCRKENSLLSQKQRSAFKKTSKKFQKEFAESHKLTYEYFVPVWKSFRSMKAHFIKNNTDIEVIEIVGA